MIQPERLFRRLVQSGIAVFLLISAFDIHHWRVDIWQSFDAGFEAAATQAFNQPTSPVWLYALAFPFVAMNFASMVAMLYGKPWVKWPFVLSMVAIAVMDLIGWQSVIYRDIWSDILTKAGYGIGGAITLFLFFRVDGAVPFLYPGTK